MYRRRRSNALPGALLLLAAVVIAFATTLPWARVSGPRIAIGLGGGSSPDVGFDVMPQTDASQADVQPLLVGFAVALAVLGLALIATRVRGLGVVWRLLGALALVVPGFIAYALWAYVADPAGTVNESSSDDVGTKLAALGLSLAQDIGLVKIQPGAGLWLLTAGSVLALLAIVIPARRTTEFVPVPGRNVTAAAIPGQVGGVPMPPGYAHPQPLPPQSYPPEYPPPAFPPR